MGNRSIIKLSALLVLSLLSMGAEAAVCTSLSAGTWNSAARWSCGHVPLAADTVVINHNAITLAANYTVAGLTVNAGMALADGGNTLTITGDLTNNGTISGGGRLDVTGAASVISGSGTYTDSRLYTSGAAPTIAAGAVLNFTGGSRLYTGRTSAGANALTSVLTINGTINSTVATATTTFLRLYANSTVVGSTGAINASVSAVSYNNSTAKLTNNGNVSVNMITQNRATNAWTQGANSSLTLTATSTVGVLDAQAAGNTVTYTSPAVPIAPLNNTYYNLAGTGVVCPHTFTVLGSDPCAPPPNSGFVVSSPGSCSSMTGVGTIPWVNPMNATASDTVYATATGVLFNTTTNYLNCTGFNFSVIPAGATIRGITMNVERKTSGGTIRDAFVYLIKAGTISTSLNGATTTNYTKTNVIEPHGGMTNLWGTTWTDADVKAANFGVAFASKNMSLTSLTNRTVSVDHIQVRVDYSTSSMDHVTINAPANAMTSTEVPVVIAPHTVVHGPIAGAGAISLSTSSGAGDWSVISGLGIFTPGAANSGQASYAFGAGESSVTLGFTSLAAGVVTLNVADAGGASLLANTPAGEKANTINFTAAAFVFTSSACTHNIAFGAPGQCARVTWSPRTAGQALANVYITAVDAAGVPTRLHPTQVRIRNMQFGLTCHDPVANAGVQATFSATASALPLCEANGAIPLTWSAGVDISFAGGSPSVGPYSFRYDDVGSVELRVRNSAATAEMGSSGAFVVKPAGFTLSNIKRSRDNFANPGAPDATGQAFAKAGEAFSATVTAVNAVGGATPNYGQEKTAETVKLTPVLAAGLGLTNNPALTCGDKTNPAICDTTSVPGADIPKFGAFMGGAATGVNFAWEEVGIIMLTPSVGDADYLGALDVTGTPSGNVGRFSLAKFALQNPLLEDRADICNGGVLIADGAIACSAFTYMDEEADVSFTLKPMSLNNVPSQNYLSSLNPAQNFAKLDPTIFANLNLAAVDRNTAGGPHYLSARISNAGMPAATCTPAPCFHPSAGANSPAQADVNVPFKFTRGAAPDGAYASVQIGFAPLDSDLAPVDAVGTAGTGTCNNTTVTACYNLDADATLGNDRALLATAEFRYGRTNISNAYGPELLGLVMPVVIEYWNSSTAAYVRSAGDAGTVIAVALGNYQGNLTAGKTTPTVSALVNGVGRVNLSAPGANNSGSVDVSVTNPAYLPSNPVGRATFGVYRGPFIYMREQY